MVEKQKVTPERKVTYDARKKELTTITTLKAMQAPNGEVSEKYGHNKNVSVLTDVGIKEVVKSLNAEKTNYQRQHKQIEQQLGQVSEVEVDTEFLAKLRAAKLMEQKQQLTDSLKNANGMIESINKQLNDIKGAVGNHIKW